MGEPSAIRTWLRAHRAGLRLAALIALALYAFYLLGANMFLNSAWAERAFNRHPEWFQIHWASAASWYPGHVRLRGLRVGGHVRTMQWSATSPLASGRVRLLPLLLRRLSFGPIDASDVVLAVDRHAAELPQPALSAKARARRPWRLHFDAIRTASVKALTLGPWRIDGAGEASFALDKVLRGGAVEVRPSHLRMPSARVRFNDTPVATGARLDFTMRMAPHTRAQAHGFERIRFVDARLQLVGRAPGVQLRARSNGALAFDPSKASGHVVADLSILRGVLQPGGRLHWNAPVSIDADGAAAQGYRLFVDADVTNDAISVRARIPKREGRPDFVDADLRTSERRLQAVEAATVLRTLSGTVGLRWHFTTLRWLNPLLSSGWLRLDGDADVVADLHVNNGRLAAGSRAEILQANVEADVFDTVLSGRASAIGKVDAARTTVDFVAQRFRIAPHAAPLQPYVQGDDLRLGLVASGDLAQFRKTMKAHLLFDDARIPDLRAYNRNLPARSLQFAGGSGRVAADLRLDAKGEVQQGRLLLHGTRADVRFGPSRIVGDLALDTRLTHAGAARRHYRLDAFNLGLDRVQVGDGPDASWWARLALAEGTLDWRQPFGLDGNAGLVMKDASVLLALFADRSAFPKWIANIVDSGQVKASAAVHADGDAVALGNVHASNDRVVLDARLRVAGGKPHGDLYAHWGVLNVGVELRNGQRKLHFKNAKQWYESQSALPDPRSGAASATR